MVEFVTILDKFLSYVLSFSIAIGGVVLNVGFTEFYSSYLYRISSPNRK